MHLFLHPKTLAGAALSLLLASPALAFRDESNAYQLPAQYEAEAGRLRNAAPQQYDFSKALMSDVLRFLATDAGISFFSLPDDSEEGQSLVTFSIKSSPFQVLETLCKANGLSMIPDNGIWYIRPADDRELLGKSYEIRHNALERVERSVDGGGLAGGGSSGSGGLDLQGARETFDVQPSEIIDDIRAILDLPPAATEGGLGGGLTSGLGGGLPGATGAGGGTGQEDAFTEATNSNELSAFRRPKVIWKSDSNTLYVVATRLQHLWVEGYLTAADKVQPMIAIEVKFLETARDPRREFGVDWTGTFENGTFRQVTDASVDPETGVASIEYDQIPTNGGYRTDLAPLLTGVDLNDVAASLAWPGFSVLSAQDVNVKLRALMRDETTTTTSYPRMVTLNNREVSIRSVVNQPVLGGSSSATLGTGATTTQAIEYLRRRWPTKKSI